MSAYRSLGPGRRACRRHCLKPASRTPTLLNHGVDQLLKRLRTWLNSFSVRRAGAITDAADYNRRKSDLLTHELLSHYSAGALTSLRGTGLGMCSQNAVTMAETSEKPASA